MADYASPVHWETDARLLAEVVCWNMERGGWQLVSCPLAASVAEPFWLTTLLIALAILPRKPLMSRHLHHDLEEAYHSLLALSGQVEEMIDLAIRALNERKIDLADQVIQQDTEIDRKEVRIEEECLKMLALHQPVAADLRRITTMMKINNDLERMADLACNIAERAHSMNPWPDFPIPSRINEMVQLTTSMVRQGLDAFVNLDIDLAYRVILQDDAVDQLNVVVIDELQAIMAKNTQWLSAAIHCFSAARHLERIADHATNIAEDVIYMVNGVIVRHRQVNSKN